MSARPQPLSLDLGFTRTEQFQFDRLKRRIVEQLEARGCRTIALCGEIEVSGRRFVELFGCVRIPADEFLEYEDEEILARVRFQIRSLRTAKSAPEKTKEMNYLAPSHSR